MSLMRLLTVGRSIGTIRNQPSRYKMTEQHLLPKFGPIGMTEAKVASKAKRTAVPKVERLKQRFLTWKKMLKPKKKMRSEALNKGGPDEQSTAVVNVPKASFPLGRWSKIKNPFGARKTAQTPSPPRQGELSLDLVKPIRNDLSDADLEVVPARKAPVSEGEEIKAPAAKPEPAGYLWSRLSSRVFRAEQH